MSKGLAGSSLALVTWKNPGAFRLPLPLDSEAVAPAGVNEDDLPERPPLGMPLLVKGHHFDPHLPRAVRDEPAMGMHLGGLGG